MSMKIWSDLGLRCLGWMGLWLLLGVHGSVVWAGSETGGSIYEVRQIEISVPLGGKSAEVAQETGMAQAQREGLQRLFKRMLTASEREARKDFIAACLKDAKRFVERSVVRGRKQVGERLDLNVEVIFSRKEVGAALTKEGIVHKEVAYPLAVLMNQEESGTGPSTLLWKALPVAAREYGLTLLPPLGDFEELTRMTWERAVRADPELMSWVAERYHATAVWAVQAQIAPVTGGKGAKMRMTATLIVSRADQQPVTFQVKEEKSGATPEEATAALYPVVAGKLVQQVMENWLSGQAVVSGTRKQVRLRVVHDAQLARLTEFLTGLRAVPGMQEPQVVQDSAKETLFACDYQGSDETLDAALKKLTVQQEKRADETLLWLVPPARTPASSAPATPSAPGKPAAPVPSAAPATKTWM
ncbi:MAG: DUF2066 domain-containing protein [Magnetococcales bacterium]|nr:DUF2066 domain-containing protein [Magnetococcales bacterium]NGZ05582.1 DUF2066 domain-containing protein [Magnetococcales bacterium]